jgi:hypothetical protein
MHWLKESFFVSRQALLASTRLIIYILVGAIFISPLVAKLPLLGWDWFFFFNANNPAFNLFHAGNAYPPYARYIIQLFTWMDWRNSLTFLNSITILTIALATWKNGGKYKEIALAIATPPLWFLMWVGHPDGLVLFGLITGLIPLVLMKPILSIFGIFSNRKMLYWSIFLFLLSNLVWPLWIFSMRNATIGHEAAMGWADLGWPLLLVGILLIIGAGKDMYCLMAAGCFLTPYLMPYHMAIIIPAIGKTRGWRQIVLWISAWLVFLGTGLFKSGHLVSLIFPLMTFCMCIDLETYKNNVRENLTFLKNINHTLAKTNEIH